jgi:hypothetical protein
MKKAPSQQGVIMQVAVAAQKQDGCREKQDVQQQQKQQAQQQAQQQEESFLTPEQQQQQLELCGPAK